MNLFFKGLPLLRPRFTFYLQVYWIFLCWWFSLRSNYLDTKSKQKGQGDLSRSSATLSKRRGETEIFSFRFAQKTGVRQTKSLKLAPSYRQELRTMGDFTLVSLVFYINCSRSAELNQVWLCACLIAILAHRARPLQSAWARETLSNSFLACREIV